MDWEIHNVIEGILKEIIHDLIFFLSVVIFGKKTSAFPNFLRQSLENSCVQHKNDSEITSKDTQ